MTRAPTIHWHELSTNQELHKGVEFGVKAAGEVSKDVGADSWKGRGVGGNWLGDCHKGITPVRQRPGYVHPS